MTPTEQHHVEWNDRLQDWLDGDLAGHEAVEFEAHLGQCPICSERLGQLEQLNDALSTAAPALSLDLSFDRRLLAQIETIDESKRNEARRRMEQELQQNLRELSRRWRRTLAFVIPGIVAGIVLAFALAGWLDASGFTRALAAQAVNQGAGQPDGDLLAAIQLALTALTGTTLGLIVARWLAGLSE